ncbi:hypothetical protein PQX77_021567, partial [Marasmius sp. AFHP31]
PPQARGPSTAAASDVQEIPEGPASAHSPLGSATSGQRSTGPTSFGSPIYLKFLSKIPNGPVTTTIEALDADID